MSGAQHEVLTFPLAHCRDLVAQPDQLARDQTPRRHREDLHYPGRRTALATALVIEQRDGWQVTRRYCRDCVQPA
ncbi:hypothetical protein P3H15_40195 [Rhodococcus sp. T2V]|uniref:hypothetical protein n=1 Tax=Rhodococcus sp. T2V TaxID=3034164 RepID=UPI0023E1FC74|nr:hypothetical protein [Rhodococcus sp. T2V]MDF3311219.1 hypothetical protein [Rhodococcus sp. T2V]